MAAYDGQLSYDWRIPNIKELSTIIERACTSPARNTDIFPVTVASVMWSSTLTLPWTGEWYSRVYTLNNSDPSKWRRVYAIRDGSL